nr:putative ribonuclease H-like domain-containing protein [Tanacetum cinerariifolium]
MELDLEARIIGKTLVLNRSLEPIYEDYIELNDLNVPLDLRRYQVDDLMPTIREGEVIDEPMIGIIKTRNNESFDEYSSFCDFDWKILIDCAYNLRFSCMIVENMDSYRDQDMGDIILKEPFCKASCVEVKRGVTAGEVPDKGDEGVSKGSGIDDQEKTDIITQDVDTVEPSINTASTSINTNSLNINTVGSNDPSMPSLEETDIFDDVYDDREVGAEADTNNLELSTVVSPIPTTRVQKDPPKEQIISDLNLTTQTRRMLNFSKENDMVSYINKQRRTNHELLIFLFSLLTRTQKGLQVKQKDDGIFISQDNYMADILKKFNFTTVKTASTPMEPNKTLIKDAKAEDVQSYSKDFTSSCCEKNLQILKRKSTTRGCPFLGKRLISWQCKKQTIVANYTTEAEYVAAANCCGHASWIQNQMLDYGFNFMNTKIYIDNEIVEGEGSGQPSEPQPPSSTTPPEQVLVAVGDEAVYIGEDDKVVRVATTVSSLEAEQESGNINKTQPTATHNELSPQGTGSEVNTSGSGEDSMEHQDDLMDFVPPTPHDSPLLRGHKPGSDEDLVIKRLKKKVKRLEKKQRARNPGMKLFKIGTSKKKTLDKERVSKQGRDESNRTDELNLSDKGSGKTKVFDYTTAAEKDVNAAKPVSTAGDAVNAASLDVIVAGPSTSTAENIFEDEITTMDDTLMAIRRTRPRTTSVVIHDVEEEPKRATLPPIVQSQDKEQAQFKRDQRTAREKAAEQEAKERKRFFAAQRAEQIRNKPPTKAQLRNKMVTYLKHMGKYTHNQLKSKSFEEIQMLYEKEQKWINDFVPMDSEEVNDSKHQAESSKKRSRADHDKKSVKK